MVNNLLFHQYYPNKWFNYLARKLIAKFWLLYKSVDWHNVIFNRKIYPAKTKVNPEEVSLWVSLRAILLFKKIYRSQLTIFLDSW